MIVGVGTDIVEVDRIQRALAAHAGFASRVFTQAERQYCLSKGNPAESLAGRFAAKEAIAKALGTSLLWLDVEILADGSGQPVVKLSNKASELANGRRVMVSISHCRSHAVAYAVVVADGEAK